MIKMRSELELKRKYSQFKHHAWAGLGFLSVFLAVTRLFSVPNFISIPITLILVFYIVISLIFTYKYREGVSSKEDVTLTEKGIIEEEKLKLEKKKAKNEEKIQKKKLKSELKAKKE